MAKSYDTVNYGDLNSIYGGREQTIRYNPQYADGTDNLLAESILNAHSSLTGDAQDDWVVPDTLPSNTTKYLADIGDSIPLEAGETAAFWIEASEDQATNKLSISAAIYTNSSSPAAVPTFGNMMLQSIAQKLTGKEKLRLSFKYTLWKQSLPSLIQGYANYAFPIMAIGNLSMFYFELFLLVVMVFVKVSGFIDNLIMKGGTRATFTFSRAVWYFAISLFYMEFFWFSNWIYGVDTTGWQLLGLLYAVAFSVYLAFFASVVIVNPAYSVIHVIFLILQMFLFSFSSAFASNVDKEPGLGKMHILSYILCFSPPSQYLIGCFLTQFRYI